MTSTVREVTEAEAEGKVKAIYDDIKATLRSPMVSALFRSLAVYPWYLELAWRNLRPNAATVYFETQADSLRAAAVDAVAGGDMEEWRLPALSDADLASLRQCAALFHYLNPKLLLCAGALRAGVNGQVPKIRLLSTADKHNIPIGIPRDATVIPAGEETPPESRATLDAITAKFAGTAVGDEYPLLARWPELLQTTRVYLEQACATEGELSGTRRLIALAREAVEALPFRMETSATAARQAGLTESQIDAVRRMLHAYWALLPGLVLAMAALDVKLVGAEEARRSPFPIDQLYQSGA